MEYNEIRKNPEGVQMDFKDKIKYDRLCRVMERNFKVTQLFAAYLSDFPRAITKEMVDILCEDGETKKEDAIAALLCEILGLDFSASDEERAIIRGYIYPCVTMLDAEKYKNDPYYKNVRIPNVTDGSWELRRESYEPYRAVICDDLRVGDDLTEIPPLGFFPERFDFPAVLEGGNEWMTLTPVDMDTCREAIAAAHGRVVTFGLGLGYYAYMAAMKDEVESVTVVEKSADVIRLFERYIFPYFPKKDKVKIVNADAFEFAERVMPVEEFDYAFVDIWRDGSDGAVAYEKMKPLEALSPKTEFSYWIKNFIVSRIRALRYGEIAEREERGELTESYDEVVRYLTDI